MQILKLLENHTGTNLQSGNDFRPITETWS